MPEPNGADLVLDHDQRTGRPIKPRAIIKLENEIGELEHRRLRVLPEAIAAAEQTIRDLENNLVGALPSPWARERKRGKPILELVGRRDDDGFLKPGDAPEYLLQCRRRELAQLEKDLAALPAQLAEKRQELDALWARVTVRDRGTPDAA